MKQTFIEVTKEYQVLNLSKKFEQQHVSPSILKTLGKSGAS